MAILIPPVKKSEASSGKSYTLDTDLSNPHTPNSYTEGSYRSPVTEPVQAPTEEKTLTIIPQKTKTKKMKNP